MAGRSAWARALESGRLGQSRLHGQRRQRPAGPAAQGRTLRRHRVGDRRDRTPLAGGLLRQADGEAAVAANRAYRRAESEAAYQVDSCQLHPRDRRPLHPGVLRIRRAVRLRHEWEAGLEERLRPAGLGLLHGAGRPVGLRQLAGDSRRPRHPASRCAEGLLRRGARPRDGQGAMANRAQRRAHLEHARRACREAAVRR